MRRLTLFEVKSDIAAILGTGDPDARIAARANEAQERLLNRAFAASGARMRYRICVGSSNCLVWPRQVRTIEAFWICSTPGRVVSEWYETLGYDEGGWGLRDNQSVDGRTLIQAGWRCTFDNVIASTASPKKIQAVASNAADDGKLIHIRYVDQNGNRVYGANPSTGAIEEGEWLTLSTSGALSSSNCATNAIYHVVKDPTSYPVRLYSYDVNTATQSQLLAFYEPSETKPLYRSTTLPGLTDLAGCPEASSDCTVNKTLTAAVRLQHVPVVADNDPFILGNLPALIDMAKAIQLKRDHFYRESLDMEASAMRELEGELAADMGDGLVITPRFPDLTTWGAGGVANYVT